MEAASWAAVSTQPGAALVAGPLVVTTSVVLLMLHSPYLYLQLLMLAVTK